MIVTNRPATPAEIEGKNRDIAWFELRERRAAKEEARNGILEVLHFEVARAWNEITCDGPPCCPNAWFLETTEGDYLRLSTWEHLKAEHGHFPGRIVTLARWPETHRIVTAEATGEPVAAEADGADALLKLPDVYGQCLVIPQEELPEEVQQVVLPAE